MTSNADTKSGRVLGGVLSAAIVIGAVALGLMVLYHVNSYPRTDDAEIRRQFHRNCASGGGSDPASECARQPVREARGPALRNR